jgi:glycosyltransferase involved in cell wall biosynthesis
MSAGATPVSFGRGGQIDIIDHKVTGYIAEYCNPRDVAEGIRWALTANLDREKQHEIIRQRFNARDIAEKYLSLI